MDGQGSKGERVDLPPRIVIGAAQGRSGKTTASIAAVRGFAKRGLSVRPFKKGPDYIDPSWLARASGRECYNLDGFLMPEADLIASFARHSAGGDVAFVEGAMGLFDGFGEAGEGSVAELARLIAGAGDTGGKCGADDHECGRAGERLPAFPGGHHDRGGHPEQRSRGTPRGQAPAGRGDALRHTRPGDNPQGCAAGHL